MTDPAGPPTPALLSVLASPAAPRLSPADWRQVLTQARRCKLAGRLARLADERGWLPDLPPPVQLVLANVDKAVRRKHLDTVWEADRLLHALQPLGMPVVLLKGAAYVLAGLPAARGREFSDVDILVPRERLRDAELALFAHGWIGHDVDPYDDRYYRTWMHELPPLQHVERMTQLDVHHTLTPPTSRFAIDIGRVLPACVPVPGHPGLLVLAPADRVLHSAVHLMQEGDFGGGLRDLVDLCDLIGHEAHDTSFWSALVARAQELGLSLPLHDAVTLAQALLALPVPDAAGHSLAAAAGPGARRRWVQALLRRAVLQPLSARGSLRDEAAAAALFLRSHGLRMPLRLLLPHLLRKAWRRTAARTGLPVGTAAARAGPLREPGAAPFDGLP